mmetsp:Transcript_8557/g.30511  ORF Transcript_8557/g.30511 Transcript_8557/m.30511 type:complete len:120 (+) Transcript_8557:549-908(+)
MARPGSMDPTLEVSILLGEKKCHLTSKDDGFERTGWCCALDSSRKCEHLNATRMSRYMVYTLRDATKHSCHPTAIPWDPTARLIWFRWTRLRRELSRNGKKQILRTLRPTKVIVSDHDV